MLTVLENGRPDRLPCQVHDWQPYYLKNYLDGISQWQAYAMFDMDYAIYLTPDYDFNQDKLANWRTECISLSTGKWIKNIITPKGNLCCKGVTDSYTTYETEHIIKNEKDFELFNEYWPIPSRVDISEIRNAHEFLGDKGVIRTYSAYYPGQGSPWQALCYIAGTQQTILWAIDKPDWVHYMLEALLEKSLKVIEMQNGIPADMQETGGGAGSNTVISPAMFREFCLPYDKKQNDALRGIGLKTVCHLCGGLMKMADMVIESGADGLETMTPISMGGDCDLKIASELFGDKLFFIGGLDQNAAFENGTPQIVKKMVFECFEATKDHAGYIISPSDHFFNGSPENIKAFADAVKECVY